MIDLAETLEKICANCRHYCFKYRKESGGWAYCRKHEQWFPNQNGWSANDGTKPPGKRTCPQWQA